MFHDIYSFVKPNRSGVWLLVGPFRGVKGWCVAASYGIIWCFGLGGEACGATSREGSVEMAVRDVHWSMQDFISQQHLGVGAAWTLQFHKSEPGPWHCVFFLSWLQLDPERQDVNETKQNIFMLWRFSADQSPRGFLIVHFFTSSSLMPGVHPAWICHDFAYQGLPPIIGCTRTLFSLTR